MGEPNMNIWIETVNKLGDENARLSRKIARLEGENATLKAALGRAGMAYDKALYQPSCSEEDRAQAWVDLQESLSSPPAPIAVGRLSKGIRGGAVFEFKTEIPQGEYAVMVFPDESEAGDG